MPPVSAPPKSDVREAAIEVGGMNCASCVAHVEKAARTVSGVQSASVSLARGRATVQFDPRQTTTHQIAQAITASGYPAAPEEPDIAAGNVEEERLARQMHEARAWLRRAIAGFVLWLPLEAIHWTLYFLQPQEHHAWLNWAALVTSTIGIVYIGRGFYAGAWSALRRGTSNMDTLISMGATVAYLYSLTAFIGYLMGWWSQLPHLYFMESTGLLALISLGHWLEARARQSAGSAIRELLNLAPSMALRLDESGEPRPVSAHDLQVGDRVLVRPGDRIAVDGVVTEGHSGVDESMISGESLPVTRSAGDNVIGGTVNQDGRLIVRATRVGSETALAQIVQLVESAQASKPPVQRLADQISAVFVPTVIGIAILTGVGWYLYGTWNYEPAKTWGTIANAVCSVLLIACPCALGLAVPAALMVGTGRGARRGILIRDIGALQNAERIDTVVLDKTGTITRGKPAVAEVISSDGQAPDRILSLAAAAEQYSEHPLADAIVQHARQRGLSIPQPTAFNNEPGYGVVATIDGQTVLVGNSGLLTRRDADFQPPSSSDSAGSLVYVASANDGTIRVLGMIRIVDELKPDSSAAIAQLHRLGLRIVLLTGDNRATAEAIAQAVAIDDVRAQVPPAQKAQVIRELQRDDGRVSWVAMVGDGINDAPALAAADLGIAIGSGSDIAKETGNIVLVGGSLAGIATAVRLSRATMKKIRQNLFFAFFYNVLAIPLAALGLLNPLIAAAAMALSDVTVIGNALLLRRTKID